MQHKPDIPTFDELTERLRREVERLKAMTPEERAQRARERRREEAQQLGKAYRYCPHCGEWLL